MVRIDTGSFKLDSGSSKIKIKGALYIITILFATCKLPSLYTNNFKTLISFVHICLNFDDNDNLFVNFSIKFRIFIQ